MYKKLACLIFGIILLNTWPAFSQQDAQFSQYMFNTLFYNPAFAGIEDDLKITSVFRGQWLGYEATFDDGRAPTTYVLSASRPVPQLKGGVGFHVVSDQLGPQRNLEIQLSYAYHLKINEGTKLSLGVRTGLVSQSIDYDQLRPLQEGDPLLGLQGRESQFRPDMAIGAFLKSDRYYAGVSFNHILESEFDFNLDSAASVLENHAYFTFGYKYEPSLDLEIEPSFLIKTDLNTYSFDVGVLATYKKIMWGGLSFRQSESASLMLGYSFLKSKRLRVGYAVDYIISDQDAKQPVSGELLVNYRIPISPPGGVKQQRSPRYRELN
ncbi:MAG: type IX secretion system membrane protein PorP/SprF [Bacteroidota bacterium]